MVLTSVMMVVGSCVSRAQATTVNDDLVDEINKRDAAESAKQLQIAQENLEFSTFKSCEDMQQVIDTFLKDNADRLRG